MLLLNELYSYRNKIESCRCAINVVIRHYTGNGSLIILYNSNQ